MKALVAGGCGFLASYISSTLVERPGQVKSLHRSVPHGADGIECVSLNYRELNRLEPYLAEAEVLVHLGSESVPRTSLPLGMAGILGEVEANSVLFEAAASAGVRAAEIDLREGLRRTVEAERIRQGELPDSDRPGTTSGMSQPTKPIDAEVGPS